MRQLSMIVYATKYLREGGVQFGEDQCRARTENAAENLVTLRRLALTLLKRDTTRKRGIRGKHKNAGWNHRYLLPLLGL